MDLLVLRDAFPFVLLGAPGPGVLPRRCGGVIVVVEGPQESQRCQPFDTIGSIVRPSRPIGVSKSARSRRAEAELRGTIDMRRVYVKSGRVLMQRGSASKIS